MWSLALLLACRHPVPPPSGAKSPTLRIVAINDFHGALYETVDPRRPGRAAGGLPWLVAAVNELRREDPDLLLLDAGDQFQGSWPVNASKGLGAVHAMNLLGIDAAAVGNHEFDYGNLDGTPGTGAFEAAAGDADYPFLSANIYSQAGEPNALSWVLPWTLIERANLRIAVVGLTTTDTPHTTVPANVAHLQFVDVVTSVQSILPDIEATKPDLTVLVGHLTGACKPIGIFEVGAACVPDGEIGALLTELPPGTFDVMVLGHAHTLLAHREGNTVLLENRAHGQVLGIVDLVLSPEGLNPEQTVIHEPWALTHQARNPGCDGTPFPMEPIDVGGRTLTPNADAVSLVEQLENRAGSLCDPLGCVSAPLTRHRQGESTLGNWLADALRAAFPTADVAVQNAGGMRADLPQGPLRREHIHAVMPFNNRSLLVEMTGRQLRTLLEIGSSGAHGILHISGASYGVDPSQTQGRDLDEDGTISDWETVRLCRDVLVGNTPLDDSATYRVATSDFLFSGGDHLGPAFADTTVLSEGPWVRDAFYNYAETFDQCIEPDALIVRSSPRIRLGACP